MSEARSSLGSPGPNGRLVDVGELELWATEAGSGPAVVFCHGFPGLGYSWRRQLPALAEHGFRAVAPDMRGYAASGGPVAEVVPLEGHDPMTEPTFAGEARAEGARS